MPLSDGPRRLGARRVAELTRKDIVLALIAATGPLNLEGLDLAGIDLSRLNLSGARLARATVFLSMSFEHVFVASQGASTQS